MGDIEPAYCILMSLKVPCWSTFKVHMFFPIPTLDQSDVEFWYGSAHGPRLCWLGWNHQRSYQLQTGIRWLSRIRHRSKYGFVWNVITPNISKYDVWPSCSLSKWPFGRLYLIFRHTHRGNRLNPQLGNQPQPGLIAEPWSIHGYRHGVWGPARTLASAISWFALVTLVFTWWMGSFRFGNPTHALGRRTWLKLKFRWHMIKWNHQTVVGCCW